jgi:chromosome segregation protein
MHAAIADLREAEAAIEHVRVEQSARLDSQGAIQARFYEAGSAVTRIEQNLTHARELRQRQRADLQLVDAQVLEQGELIERDRSQTSSLAAELATMGPGLDTAHAIEQSSRAAREAAEQALAAWQHAWDGHAKSVAAGQGATQVERARIEQLEGQQQRLLQQRERQSEELAALAGQSPAVALEELQEAAALAADASERAQRELQEILTELAAAREREREETRALHELRSRWQSAVSTQVSTEALQQAALGKVSGKVTQWLKSHSLDQRPRLAQQLHVERGWERAVETVLDAYLEAVCVDGLDGVAEVLASFDGGQLAVVTDGEGAVARTAAEGGLAAGLDATALRSKVQGAAVAASLLAGVYTAENLGDALATRRTLPAGASVVTRDGIWIGPDWLRLSRDRDPHAGVIEREEALREIRGRVAALADEVQALEHQLTLTRDRVREREDQRERYQSDVNRLHREHVDRRAARDAAQARAQEITRRRGQLQTGIADIAMELERSDAELRAARGRMETAIEALAALEPERILLERERERMRAELQEARAAAEAAQHAARELALQVESRRSSLASLTTTVARIEHQIGVLAARRGELAAQLSGGEAPLAALQAELDAALAARQRVEDELHAARLATDELDAQLRDREAARGAIERRVDAARHATEEARLAVEQIKMRRENVLEQLTATPFEFAALIAELAAEATVEAWESALAETGAKIERLGQVNLAAIEEFKEQSERKEYLDRQFKDLTDALETLESAMRKIDRETRARFQDTFDRVNAGLKEKFPRLFGGGHAYLELDGEDSSAAGVSVMARPPGKRNSTISQLSGGEKALTAVALVFAIFDLNPAPFCLLDEVDAPLDENNVGRFCDIVREMSRSVQFIFITHNKSTMELASQLVGVTMHEPGVSRLVAVDVDEAVRLTAM